MASSPYAICRLDIIYTFSIANSTRKVKFAFSDIKNKNRRFHHNNLSNSLLLSPFQSSSVEKMRAISMNQYKELVKIET